MIVHSTFHCDWLQANNTLVSVTSVYDTFRMVIQRHTERGVLRKATEPNGTQRNPTEPNGTRERQHRLCNDSIVTIPNETERD